MSGIKCINRLESETEGEGGEGEQQLMALESRDEGWQRSLLAVHGRYLFKLPWIVAAG